MTRDPYAEELENERAAEKRYAEGLQRRASRPQPVQGARSTFWTGSGLTKAQPAAFGELVGRVALDVPSDDFLEGKSEFYIGYQHYDLDGVQVFNWAARVACTFFRGSTHHPLCERAAVIRTFAHSNGRLIGFHDEALVEQPPAQPFSRRELEVPRAPSLPRLPSRRRAVLTPEPEGEEVTTERPAARPEGEKVTTERPVAEPRGPAHDEDPQPQAPSSRKPRPVSAPLRAESLLRDALSAPRQTRLASVLSTLQADQYELVASPGRTNRVIEGQPGTGKTIIAAHRAAFLVSRDNEMADRPDGRVLLVGPSRDYSEHIAGLVKALAPESSSLEIVDLPRLLEMMTGQRAGQLNGPPTRGWQDVDHEVADLSVRAVHRLRLAGKLKSVDRVEGIRLVYEALRAGGGKDPIATEGEWLRYLRELPVFERVRDLRAFQPLLAYIGWRVQPDPNLRGIGHIIVDEAQDVHPIEWDLLYELNRSGSWTILGDLNQRRSDYTEPSWERIATTLNIFDGDAVPLVKLSRGYRSTRPIIQYANRLLPRRERELESVQAEGPAPYVEKTSHPEDSAIRHGNTLLGRHPNGTVAIISSDPEAVCRILRQMGWVADRGDRGRWTSEGRAIAVLHPDRARGLEFDGVVVVEPAAFPQNVGRQGQLYTALTRANRELVVVHRKALPEELRRRRGNGLR